MLKGRMQLLLGLVTGLVLVSALAASAEIVIYAGDDDLPKAGALPLATAGEIKVNSAPVLELPGGGGGVPLAVRAEILDTRMTEVLSSGQVGPVIIGAIRGKPTIWVGEYRFVTVYPEDAAALGMSAAAVAAQWAAQLQAALVKTSPALGPSPEETRAGLAGPAG